MNGKQQLEALHFHFMMGRQSVQEELAHLQEMQLVCLNCGHPISDHKIGHPHGQCVAFDCPCKSPKPTRLIRGMIEEGDAIMNLIADYQRALIKAERLAIMLCQVTQQRIPWETRKNTIAITMEERGE